MSNGVLVGLDAWETKGSIRPHISEPCISGLSSGIAAIAFGVWVRASDLVGVLTGLGKVVVAGISGADMVVGVQGGWGKWAQVESGARQLLTGFDPGFQGSVVDVDLARIIA